MIREQCEKREMEVEYEQWRKENVGADCHSEMIECLQRELAELKEVAAVGANEDLQGKFKAV